MRHSTVQKLIFLFGLLIVITFLSGQDANAVTISAVPQEPVFGPNDWIKVDLNIGGYSGGPITWVAHRPDNSVTSGTLYDIGMGTTVHQIIRDASDNYFGTWSIDYLYNGVKETIHFSVSPITLTVLTDKELYYEPDKMQINITTSYYNPNSNLAKLYHLNFFDKKGNPANSMAQIDIRALQQSLVYNFPLIELSKYNPPGLYKLRIQYYNTIVEAPFTLGDISKLMEITAQTNSATYIQDDNVSIDLVFTRVIESTGTLKITDPAGNVTSSQFQVESVHTPLVLKDIAHKIGTYRFEVQYGGVTKTGHFNVVAKTNKIPNVDLQIILDKLNYRRGEIVHAKIHTSSVIADSISMWIADPNGTQHPEISLPMVTNDTILPYRIANYTAGTWKFYVNYGGIVRSELFYVYTARADDKEILDTKKFVVPTFVSKFGSTNFTEPAGIAIDSDDNVYVADSGNARIQMFDKSGNFLFAWGSYGDIPSMFHMPVAISSDGIGDLFVADSGRNTIQIFDTGDVYKYQIHSPLTKYESFPAIDAIAFDSTDDLYAVSTDDKVLEYSSIGDFKNFFGSSGTEEGRFSNPSAVAIDSKDNFYVVDTGNHRIQKFDVYGNFILSWGTEGTGPGQFGEPVGVAIDSSGNIYVADKKNSNIQKFSYARSGKIATPMWMRDSAAWWSAGVLDKTDFAQGISYMIRQGLIKAPLATQINAIKIPDWLKANAGLWSSGQIDDKTFAMTIQYLIESGIVKV